MLSRAFAPALLILGLVTAPSALAQLSAATGPDPDVATLAFDATVAPGQVLYAPPPPVAAAGGARAAEARRPRRAN